MQFLWCHAGKGEKLSFFRQGDFTDLCAGPHLMSTGAIRAIKLTSATGAYWRGDASKAMLCRVYGTAFPKASQLEAHLNMLFLMASCGAAPKADPFDEQTFLKDITPNVSCLDACVQEVFGAQADMDTVYLAAYESESAYAGGTGKIALLFKQGEEDKYGDYYIDPAYTSYYPVTNFKTNAEVADYLKKYLSQSIIDQWFSNDFLEYDGQLYLVRGARGYGAMHRSCGSDTMCCWVGERSVSR